MSSPRNILVGYDGSDSGERALERAADLAGYGSVVTVVSAHAGLMAEARERLLKRNVPALYVQPARDMDKTLGQRARELGVDLIVVARPAIDGLVHDAPCDVLVVR